MLLGAHDVGWKSILAHLYGLEGSDHPYEVIRSYENSVPSERDFYLLFTVVDDIRMFINPASSRRKRSESQNSITVEVCLKATFIIRVQICSDP